LPVSFHILNRTIALIVIYYSHLLDPRTEQQEEISKMSLYILRLENSLGELQKKVSAEPHPLLVGAPPSNLVTSRHPSHDTITSKPSQGPFDEDADLLAEAFGVLSMRSQGNGEFHGPTATSEVRNYTLPFFFSLYDCLSLQHFLKAHLSATQPSQETEHEGKREVELNFLKNYQSTRMHAYPDIVLLNVQFPCPPDGQAPPDMNRFLNLMPSYERARMLLDNYLLYISWS
jgi:hypothetical protein